MRLSREDRSALMRNEREPVILAAAMKRAARDGYRAMSRDDIAADAGIAPSLINHYFGNMTGLRNAVMAEAVRTEQLDVIAQGLADGHSVARDAPAHVREAAIRAIA